MSDTRYNGWSNYETWAVHLWLTNEQASDSYWRETAQETYKNAKADTTACFTKLERAQLDLAATLKSEHEEALPELQGFAGDLLNAALGSVDWYEIATALLEGVAEEVQS